MTNAVPRRGGRLAAASLLAVCALAHATPAPEPTTATASRASAAPQPAVVATDAAIALAELCDANPEHPDCTASARQRACAELALHAPTSRAETTGDSARRRDGLVAATVYSRLCRTDPRPGPWLGGELFDRVGGWVDAVRRELAARTSELGGSADVLRYDLEVVFRLEDNPSVTLRTADGEPLERDRMLASLCERVLDRGRGLVEGFVTFELDFAGREAAKFDLERLSARIRNELSVAVRALERAEACASSVAETRQWSIGGAEIRAGRRTARLPKAGDNRSFGDRGTPFDASAIGALDRKTCALRARCHGVECPPDRIAEDCAAIARERLRAEQLFEQSTRISDASAYRFLSERWFQTSLLWTLWTADGVAWEFCDDVADSSSAAAEFGRYLADLIGLIDADSGRRIARAVAVPALVDGSSGGATAPAHGP